MPFLPSEIGRQIDEVPKSQKKQGEEGILTPVSLSGENTMQNNGEESISQGKIFRINPMPIPKIANEAQSLPFGIS